MKTNKNPCRACPKAHECEENELDYLCDDILKYEMKQRFMPMNEEEQRAFLNMCIESYFELYAMKPKTEADARVIDAQASTYSMIINLFNTPADDLKEIGFDPRALLKEFYDKEEEKGEQA